MGRSEDEPHPMSLENAKPGDEPSPCRVGEGRRAQGRQSPASGPNSGGVSVGGTLGSQASEGWEICDSGASQPPVQAGVTGEAGRAAAEVGVLHRSVDLWMLDAQLREEFRESAQREGTCQHAQKRGKGAGDGPRGIQTPSRHCGIRKLQLALYRKARAEPKWRFWSLYGEIYRRDILEQALRLVARNGGAPGVDGETIGSILATPQTQESWLSALQEALRTKTYRPKPLRRVYIAKSGGGQRALGIPTVTDRVAQMALYLVLMPIFEADFHPHSFGYRPKRNAHQAIDQIVGALRSGRTEVVVDADPCRNASTPSRIGSCCAQWLGG